MHRLIQLLAYHPELYSLLSSNPVIDDTNFADFALYKKEYHHTSGRMESILSSIHQLYKVGISKPYSSIEYPSLINIHWSDQYRFVIMCINVNHILY